MKGKVHAHPTGKLLTLIGLCLIIFIIFQVVPAISGSKKPPANHGPLAPNFTLPSLSGGEISLKDYRGKVVLLDFWSIHCPPCRRAVPHLVIMYERYKNDGFVALGVSFDRRDINELREFVGEYQVAYPILLGNMEVARAYGIRSIPSMFLLDKKGHIRLHRIGFNEEIGNEIEEYIKRLIKEK